MASSNTNTLLQIPSPAITLRRPLLPYGYSYKASCARPGQAVVYNFWHPGTEAQSWASECPDVRNYKWRLNPVWHRMLYSCTHMATVGVDGLTSLAFVSYGNSANCVVNGSAEYRRVSVKSQGLIHQHRHSPPHCVDDDPDHQILDDQIWNRTTVGCRPSGNQLWRSAPLLANWSWTHKEILFYHQL